MDHSAFGVPPVNRIYGVVIGVVTDNNDPEGMYRVKVKFPWVMSADTGDTGEFSSTWCRITTFMGGADRGSFFLPEKDDEVLVVFEHGDVRRPFVIGSLWSPKDKPIHDNKSQRGKNDFRTIYSRCGHIIQFEDKKGKEKIILQTKAGVGEAATAHKSRSGHFIVMDCSSGAEKIQIYDGPQKNFLEIDSTNNKIHMKSAEGNILIEAPQGEIKLSSKTLLTESSSTTTIKSQAAMTIQSQATADIKSSSGMTIKGSTVNIN